MNWFIPAILASLVWGIGQALIKKGLSSVTPLLSNTFAVICALVVEIPFALIGGVKWEYFPFIFIFGLLANLPNFVFPYVIEKANVSLAGTLLATYPIYTIILSILFLKESLDIVQILGIIGIIVGMFYIAKPENEKFKLAKWVIYAVIGSVAIGFGDFIGKISITKYGLYSFIMAFTLANIPCILITRLLDKTPIKLRGDKKAYIYSMLGNVLMPLGLLFLYMAFSKGPASLASPIASTYPAITVLLAYFYLKEKITKTNFLGILMATVGVVLVGI